MARLADHRQLRAHQRRALTHPHQPRPLGEPGEPAAVVVLEVRDDGRGFTGLTEGSGLMGMRERAALVRAELSVISQPRHGTTVRLKVPVDTTAEGSA